MSEANRISVVTNKSLHNPVEVEINGTVYPVRMSRGTFKKFREMEKLLEAAPGTTESGWQAIDIVYDQVILMTGAPREEVEAVDLRDIRAIIEYVLGRYYGKKISSEDGGKKEETEIRSPEAIAEKKPQESGETESPKSPLSSPDSSPSKI